MKTKFLFFVVLLLVGCTRTKVTKFIIPEDNTEKKVESVPLLLETPKPYNDPVTNEEVLQITEKMFLTQINDIFYNYEDYKDTTIYVEGMFTYFVNSSDESLKAPVVFRFGPGCCGNDGWGGFLLDYDGEFPADNEWIGVKGKPVIIEDGVYAELHTQVESIEVKTERGSEYVTH